MADVGGCDQKIILLTIEEAKKAHKCVMIEIANLINDFGPAGLRLSRASKRCWTTGKKILSDP